ncbi:MAG TPA: flagellar basal body rod protein FlgC [Chthonomonadaceae bacterium]|nr:flagellar basal body rod protein FlgC [Chthonomonadaceae bacterium]
MALGSSMQISASGLTAERLRLDVISNNLANVNTTRDANGQPFRRQIVTLTPRTQSAFASALSGARGANAGGQGVQVSAVKPDMSAFKIVHDPGHPDADAQGNVKMPNVEPIVEMVDMISASRAYEAGVTAINSAKQMESRALDIGRA